MTYTERLESELNTEQNPDLLLKAKYLADTADRMYEQMKREHEHMLAYKFAYEELCNLHNTIPEYPTDVYDVWEAKKAGVKKEIPTWKKNGYKSPLDRGSFTPIM